MTTAGTPTDRFRSVKFVADLLVTVCVLIAAGLVVWSNLPRRGRVAVLPKEPISIEGLATRGNKDAKVVLLEYADFQCPSCAVYFRSTLPRVERQYIESGLVKVVFRHLPLPQHELAWPAAMAAECAGREGKFWDMHDLAFKNQRDLTEPTFLAWASQLGLDPSQFQACLSADSVRRRIETDLDSAENMQIASTPTFIVGRVQADGAVKLIKLASSSFADIQRAVDQALAGEEDRSMTSLLLSYGAGIAVLLVIGSAAWLRVRRRRRGWASAQPAAS